MTNENPSSPAVPTRPKSWVLILSRAGFLFAVAAVLLAVFSGFGTKWGWWDFRLGLKLFLYSAVAGAVGLVLSIAGLSLFKYRAAGLLKYALGALLSLLITVNFLARFHFAKQVPPIHDITTDTQDPPLFDDAILALRKGALNPPEYGGLSIAEQQQKAYPDIQPLVLNKPVTQVWRDCLNAANQMKWVIDLADEPHGRLEATDTTFWFGFKDDVVVRVKDEKGQSRVDMRSVSRVGRGDVGTNAKRIRRFLELVRQGS
jgi:uncharacterized protein (DUF1499 family)